MELDFVELSEAAFDSAKHADICRGYGRSAVPFAKILQFDFSAEQELEPSDKWDSQ